MSELMHRLHAQSHQLLCEWLSRLGANAHAPAERELNVKLGDLRELLGAVVTTAAETIAEYPLNEAATAARERAETLARELRQSEERVRRVLEASGAGLWELDARTHVIASDARMRELMGFSAEQPMDLEVYLNSLPIEADRRSVLDALQRALAGEDEGKFLTEFRTGGHGKPVRWLESRAQASFDAHGNATRLSGVVMDITPRKEAERELLAKTTRLNLLLDNNKDYAFVLTDVRGTVLEWQGAAETITGYPAEEAIGSPSSIVFTPEDRAAGAPEVEMATASQLGRAEDKRWHMKKDGSRFFADGVMTALYDTFGRLNSFGKVFRDATAQQQAEEALRRSDARLRLALRAGRMGTWELDLGTRELTCSDTCKANYGRAPHEPFSYADLAACVFDEDRAEWQSKFEHAIENCADLDLEYRVRWPDQSVHWVHVRASCTVLDARASTLSGVSSSIDERKAFEEELRAADRRKDEFLTTASHELRTPLNAILGWASMLRGGHLGPEVARRAAETIERNARAQVQLIEDILDGSRIITGKLRLEVRPLDLTELVHAAVDAIRPAAEAKQIALTVEVDRAAGRVIGDPDRLQQVIWNLVNNAIKFTPKGGRVSVTLARRQSSVELRVADTGQGIAPDFLPYVFDRFRQADSTTTRRHGGLGLGLALVRHLVDAHGGEVHAESEGVNRGATFVVTLPVQAVITGRYPSSEARLSPTEASAASLHGVSVLVVDDEPDARDLIAAVLRERGAQVTTAANADEAIEQCEHRKPAVLVSDIGMPKVDGYALLQNLRERSVNEGAPKVALALTAYTREDDRKLALAAGFDAHVKKPVEPSELVRVIVELLSAVPANGHTNA
jgi:PAS domain S-box-containing protein